MPIVPPLPQNVVTAAASGFTGGVLVSAAVLGRLDTLRQRRRQALLEYRADALFRALDALAEDGELDYRHMHAVSGLRDQAEALAEAVKGAARR